MVAIAYKTNNYNWNSLANTSPAFLLTICKDLIHAPGKTGIYMNSLKILDKKSTMKSSLGSHG